MIEAKPSNKIYVRCVSIASLQFSYLITLIFTILLLEVLKRPHVTNEVHGIGKI